MTTAEYGAGGKSPVRGHAAGPAPTPWGNSDTLSTATAARQLPHPLRNLGSPQQIQSDSVVVVLGVMYPSVLPQLVEANTHLGLVPLPPGFVGGRQSVDSNVFYDPLSSSRNGDEVPRTATYRRNSKGDGHLSRTESRKTVVRDLALLSL